MGVFEGQQLGAEGSLPVLDGLGYLQENRSGLRRAEEPDTAKGAEPRAHLLQVLVDGDVGHWGSQSGAAHTWKPDDKSCCKCLQPGL